MEPRNHQRRPEMTNFRRLGTEDRHVREASGRTKSWSVLTVVLSLLVATPPVAAIGADSADADTRLGDFRPATWTLAPRGLRPCGADALRPGAAIVAISRHSGADDNTRHALWRSRGMTPMLVRPVPRTHDRFPAGPAAANPAAEGLWEDAYGSVWCGGQCVSSQRCCVIMDPSTPTDTAKRTRPLPPDTTKPARTSPPPRRP